jgi:hypothetical protein
MGMSIHNETTFKIHGYDVKVYIARENWPKRQEQLHIEIPDELRFSLFKDHHFQEDFNGNMSAIIDPIKFMELPNEG